MALREEKTKKRSNSLDYKPLKNDLSFDEKSCFTNRRNKSFFQKRNYIPNNFFKKYTSICKKFYPLIMFPGNKSNICKNHYNIFSFYCFTCKSHFCINCKSVHLNHSYKSFDELKFNEEDILKEEKAVSKRISLIFNNELNKSIDKRILQKLKNELIEFNYFIIDSYRNDKNNFYHFFNYYYCFILKEDLKSKENDLLKGFFGLYGFKKLIHNLQFFYEQRKYFWLLRNLVAYKKHKIREEIIEKRKNEYNFENIYVLIQNEGF